MKIAALLTSFNRKEQTVKSLNNLYSAYQDAKNHITLSVYLTDDGSSDGTADAVRMQFPEVIILQGKGNLYWAGGMRNSWREALNGNYDAFLLLNDDTFLLANVFDEFIQTDIYSKAKFHRQGIYVGSIQDPETFKLTYGGSVLSNKLLLKFKRLNPIGIPQACDVGNANVMFVPHTVVKKIGILSEKYKHGVADYDYTLKAKKQHIPVLITPNFCGICRNDNINKYALFLEQSFTGRVKFLFAPTGLAFLDNLIFMYRNFPIRLFFVFFIGLAKVIFPKLYYKIRTDLL